MTVAELIEELRRLPSNKPVLIEFPNGCDDLTASSGFDLGSIDELREAQAFAHHQPVVIISAASWVR